MDQNDNKNITRRDFLKIIGISAATSSALFYSCDNNSSTEKSGQSTKGKGTMTYRTNHNTGDKVSILGYGCMRWPTLPAPSGDGNIIDQDAVNELVDYAIANGVNYFDTAPVYVQGFSELSTGNALSRHPRNSYFIATKMSNFSDWSKENSIKMYRKSFENLQTDYIDYYLLHSVGNGGLQQFKARYIDNGMLDFLIEERKKGHIRNLGWSFHGTVDVFDYVLSLHDYAKWDFVQIQLNYVDWLHATGNNVNAEYLYSELEKRNIPVIIMEPLLGGRLAGINSNLVAKLKQRRPEDSVASWAFRFAASPDKVLTVLSGMTYFEHLQDNINTYSPLIPVSDDEKIFLEEIAQIMIKFPTVPCTDCKYCMPCPYGIDIPSIFSHYNKCVNEGNISTGINDDNYKKARRAFLIGYDRSVPRLRQANHCIGCNQCAPHCPQSIDIPKELHHIDEYVEHLKQNNL